MFKKIIITVFLGLTILITPTKAQGNPVRLYFFHGNGCPHCADEEKFLPALKSRYPELQVLSYEVWYNQSNQELMQKVAKKFNTTVTGVPFNVIGDQYVEGFGDTTRDQIQSLVENCIKNGCPDPAGEVIGLTSATTTSGAGILKNDNTNSDESSKKINLIDYLLLGVGVLVLAGGIILIVRQNKKAEIKK